MESSVRIDEARGLVVVTTAGAMTRAGTMQMVAAARAAAGTHGGLPILYDLREATPGRLSRGDIFWMARQSPALKQRLHVRVATLFPGAFGDIARFWEDSFRNAGLEARAFDDEAHAVAWLRREEAPRA